MKKVPIKLATANALKWLGSLYRNPADALKEHVSNAIDEHLKAKTIGKAVSVCLVRYKLEKDRITIEYPYGMSKKEFEEALQRVADSAKKSLEVSQIGQLGIGMFSFLQLGNKCVCYSKKEKGVETVKVTLREGADEADFETATKKESLSDPGIKIVISGLKFDPTKPRGPLSVDKLKKVFADKFDAYLKGELLQIQINSKRTSCFVEPQRIDLPKIGESYKSLPVRGDRAKIIGLELYFDPSKKGMVSIRHTGVTIVDDIKTLTAYGLEESVYASGDIKGHIDANFLKPLPARVGFEENNDWINFLNELDKIRPSIEAEVEIYKQQEAEKVLTEIQKQAFELARDILNAEDFKELELLEGLGRKAPEPRELPNGFDFVPPSIRIKPGEEAHLALKAYVPKVLPDNSLIKITISDSSFVEKKEENLYFRASQANEYGVVTEFISLKGIKKTISPIFLTANATIREIPPAIARIRVAEPDPTRVPEKAGPRIIYEEVPFEEGASKHSRYISRKIQINEINKDFMREKKSKLEETMLAYATLMIGKETIAFQDKSGFVDDYLEKLLTFHFELKDRLGGPTAKHLRKARGRQEK